MTDLEVAQWRLLLGVGPGVPMEALRQAYLKKSYALIKAGASEEEKEQLRRAHEGLVSYGELQAEHDRINPPKLARPAYVPPPEPDEGLYDVTSFDSAVVDAVAPPVVVFLAFVVSISPLNFFLVPFQIWVHEFGHATVAWLTGKRAIPLPLGWTNIAFERSEFVYFGVLALLVVLFVASMRERLVVPMVAAVVLAGAQFTMTWRLPEETARMWIAFAGVGGEFYLSTLVMILFYVRLPVKFRWGACRYLFLFLAASRFYASFSFWWKVKHGLEGIPYGSMVNGEDDQSGDMDTLAGDFGWTQHKIIATYSHLGEACLVILVAVYVLFASGVGRRLRDWLFPVPIDPI